jgi:hypothetical protein
MLKKSKSFFQFNYDTFPNLLLLQTTINKNENIN